MPNDDLNATLDSIEKALIGTALCDWPSLAAYRDVLTVDCFALPRHQKLWQAILAVAETAQPDVDLVAVELSRRGTLEETGGRLYLVECLDTEFMRAHAGSYVDQLIAARNRRKLASIGQQLLMLDAQTDAQELLAMLQAVMDAVQDSRRPARPLGGADVARAIDSDVTRRKNGQEPSGIVTGFHGLDQLCGGWENGDMIVLAARPSMGKTALAVNIATRAARHGTVVGIISLEMPAVHLGLRIAAHGGGIGLKSLRDPAPLTAEAETRFRKGVDILSRLPLWIEAQCGGTLDNVVAAAQRLKRDYHCEFLVIDYLQLIRSPRPPANQNAWTAFVSQSIKSLAQTLDIPILILSQLNRAVETRGSANFRPCLSDLRDSGAIEQDADMVIFIYRPEMYQGQLKTNPIKINGQPLPFEGLAEIIVAKNRNGETGSCLLTWIGERTCFENRAGEQMPLPSACGGD